MTEGGLKDIRERLRTAVITEGEISPGELIDKVGDVMTALTMGLEIWDEYMSQIGNCCSQDYGRLNNFPNLCRELGIEIKDGKAVTS